MKKQIEPANTDNLSKLDQGWLTESSSVTIKNGSQNFYQFYCQALTEGG
jgi:hypothetical protein